MCRPTTAAVSQHTCLFVAVRVDHGEQHGVALHLLLGEDDLPLGAAHREGHGRLICKASKAKKGITIARMRAAVSNQTRL